MYILDGWVEGMKSECKVLDALCPFRSEQSLDYVKPYGFNFRVV